MATMSLAEPETLPRLLPLPFHASGLGKLPTEVRQNIYKYLLASPPPYAGREIGSQVINHARVSTANTPAVAPTDFIDLRASCFMVLRTCRQIYWEAHPVFFAGKSYYAANGLDLYRILGPRPDNTEANYLFAHIIFVQPKSRPCASKTYSSNISMFTRESLICIQPCTSPGLD